jgi:hypothetical protein
VKKTNLSELLVVPFGNLGNSRNLLVSRIDGDRVAMNLNGKRCELAMAHGIGTEQVCELVRNRDVEQPRPG